MNISKRIASIREAKGFTQKQIADFLDMEQSNYSRLEGRDNKLTIEQLEKIASALGVSVVELLTGESQKIEDREEIGKLRKRIEELEKIEEEFFNLLDGKKQEQIQMSISILFLFTEYLHDFCIEKGFIKEEQYSSFMDQAMKETDFETKIDDKNIDVETRIRDKVFDSINKVSITNLMSEEQIVLAIENLDQTSKGFLDIFFEKNMIIDKTLVNAYYKYLAFMTLKKISKNAKKYQE